MNFDRRRESHPSLGSSFVSIGQFLKFQILIERVYWQYSLFFESFGFRKSAEVDLISCSNLCLWDVFKILFMTACLAFNLPILVLIRAQWTSFKKSETFLPESKLWWAHFLSRTRIWSFTVGFSCVFNFSASCSRTI